MQPARRIEYLKAMGIETWIPRTKADPAVESRDEPPLAAAKEVQASRPDEALPGLSIAAQQIVVCPGTGDTLLLCGQYGEHATALAADIARSLGHEPVWSWPAQDATTPGLSLEQAVKERLFTRVIVFGQVPAADPASRVIGSARLVHVDALPVLSRSSAARRALWLALNEQ